MTLPNISYLDDPRTEDELKDNFFGPILTEIGAKLVATNNLSDLDDAVTARVNIGLEIGADVLAPDGSAANLTNVPGDVVTTRGDVIIGDSSGDPSRLAVGSAGQVLTTDGTDVSWGDVGGGGIAIITATRDMAAASGNVSYTGAGFYPSMVRIDYAVDSSSGGCGIDNGSVELALMTVNGGSAITNYPSIVYARPSPGNIQSASCTFITDGIQLTWTKTGAPTGTLYMIITFYE